MTRPGGKAALVQRASEARRGSRKMVLKVYKYGEKVLREKAQPVPLVTDAHRRLANDMLETMDHARGVGLAAQQVGETVRLCVIDIPETCETEEDAQFNASIRMPLKMWNPVILSKEGSVCDKEGCLSFPAVGGESDPTLRLVAFAFMSVEL